MSADPFQEARRKAREQYRRETADEATDTERERDAQAGVDAFDRAHYARFGRYPSESPLAGTTPAPDDSRRREAIQALIDRGATEGERAAATAAMHRIDHPSETAHAATERGSYYARDTLTGSTDE